MSSNKQVVQAFITALGKGDVEGLKATISEDIEAICLGTSLLSGTRGYAEVLGAAGMLGQVTQHGIEFRIVSMTAEEDRVSAEFDGFSTLVNGQPYNNQYHFLFFIRDGRIYRMKEYIDTKLADAALGPFVAGLGA